MMDNAWKRSVIIDSVFDFFELFECDYKCLELLEQLRWKNGFVCPRCEADKGYRIPEHKVIQCARCRHQTSATSGTIFHKTHLPLRKWFVAILLLLSDKSGLSAQRLHIVIDVSYKTALSMLKKLRALMGLQNQEQSAEAGLTQLLSILKSGTIAPIKGVFGIFDPGEHTEEKEGIPVRKSASLEDGRSGQCLPIISVSDPKKRKHHGVQAKVSSRSHTQAESMSIVGSVALTKHFFLGAFHRASSKYLQLYFDEFTYRYNQRSALSLIMKFLSECSRTSPSRVLNYIQTITQRNGSYNDFNPGTGMVHDSIAIYSSKSLKSPFNRALNFVESN